MSDSTLGRVASLYGSYGPGRSPGAHRLDVGESYAHMTAMLVFLLVYGYQLTDGLDTIAGEFGLSGTVLSAVITVPLFVLVALAAGFLSWRYLPERTPYVGASAGVLATFLMHVAGTFLILVILIRNAEALATPVDFVVALGSLGGIFYLWTTEAPVAFAVVYATGVDGGYVYERVQETAVP